MPSGITVKIKLDKFYQEFLKHQFLQSKSGFFIFDKSHDLSIKLGILLTKPPKDFTPKQYGKETFEIELPYSDVKDVRSYNYLSVNNEKILCNHIHLYFKIIFHEEIHRLRELGFQKKEAVLVFMSNYDISAEYFDRLMRAYSRWIEKNRRIKLAKNKSKKMLS